MKQSLEQDENLWLEEIEGDQALAWVHQQNTKSQGTLEAEPGFADLRGRLEAIFQSDQRIPVATVRGQWLYNFWQDQTHVNGIWRRTTLSQYLTSNPEWQVLLDLDALSMSEGNNWVWGGAQVLYPEYRHALVKLSVGGSDACVWREFDVHARRFVEDGFKVPEGKAQVAWIDQDTIFVCANSGPGSMTASGYPRTVRIWPRGEQLANLPVEFSVEPDEMMARAWCSRDWFQGEMIERQWLNRQITFQKSQTLVKAGGAWVALDVPLDADIGSYANQLLVMLKSDWAGATEVWPQGALLAIGMDQFMAGSRHFELLFAPSPRLVLSGWFNTHNHLYLMQMDDLVQRVERLELVGQSWQRQPIEVAAGVVTELFAYDPDCCDDIWAAESGPLFPTRLGLIANGGKATIVKRIPPLFDADRPVGRALRLRARPTARWCPTWWSASPAAAPASRLCCRATVALRLPDCRCLTVPQWARRGSHVAAATWWPEFAVVVNSARPGTSMQCAKRSRTVLMTSSPWPAIWQSAGWPNRPTWASRAAATAACWLARC